jgi:hypothetical protein
VAEITLDVWLYGALAQYGGEASRSSYANLKPQLPEGTRLRELLERIRMPTEERGITFINGQLSAMPGLQPDLDRVLEDGDRLGIFDPKSMWPFQYRHGAAMTSEMAAAMDSDEGKGQHHAYEPGHDPDTR